mmetsp:Transcript_91087/g.288512  ORF Transcript_91087/g.288512 Transcript_91087/m.288512 type:complete len:111 (-) Transcript_91087:38-370(-)
MAVQGTVFRHPARSRPQPGCQRGDGPRPGQSSLAAGVEGGLRASMAIFALALISEPRKLFWNEVFLDTALSAWFEAVARRRREQALPPGQRIFEQELEAAGLHAHPACSR